jgi:hypothetical protein
MCSFYTEIASRKPFLRASFFGFRSVSSKESPQRGPPRTPEDANRFNLTLTKQALIHVGLVVRTEVAHVEREQHHHVGG